jgi:glutamate N-acetyltransferase/amino-acid N-acetyltransferase
MATSVAMKDLSCPGIRFAGAAGGIKKKGGRDVGIIAADKPVSAAAVFTQNRVKAAPVVLSQKALRASGGKLQAIVVNSGNANACTGRQGMADARRMAERTAAIVGGDAGRVLVCSTGVIGQPLPMARVDAGIDAAGAALSERGFGDFADAILTTDRGPKVAARIVKIGKGNVTLVGCTKGAGMIAPNMATTLTFLATDAALPPGALQRAVARAVEPTFNAIAVDGDTSTNDTLAILASGRSSKAAAGKDLARFTDALTDLLDDLAHQLMADGEGVHHVVTVRVRGAASDRAARAIALRVATSPLVKTAIAGGDPNWGRFLCAVGNAGVPIRPERIDLWLGDHQLVAAGQAAPGLDDAKAAAIMKQAAYALTVDLHGGAAEARYLACDLSHEYVSINADYRS